MTLRMAEPMPEREDLAGPAGDAPAQEFRIEAVCSPRRRPRVDVPGDPGHRIEIESVEDLVAHEPEEPLDAGGGSVHLREQSSGEIRHRGRLPVDRDRVL
jgi:hypothetical protein